MDIIGGLLLFCGILATVHAWVDLGGSTSSKNNKMGFVVFGLVACFLGVVLLGSKNDIKRCAELAAQGKEVLEVDNQCWVSIGNDMFIQNNSKYTEVKTRAELTAE